MNAQKDIAIHQFQSARNKLENLFKKVSLNNEKGEVLYWIGFSYISQKSYFQSQKCLTAADEMYKIGYLKGMIKARLISVYLAQNNSAAATQCYAEMLIGQFPELAEVEYNLGNYYSKKGLIKQASTFYSKCYKRNDLYFSAKAKPLIANIGDGRFYLQVGIYSKFENVKEIAKKLRYKYNLIPSVVKIYKNGRPLYRIQTGHFQTRAEAEKRKLELKYKFRDLEVLVKP